MEPVDPNELIYDASNIPIYGGRQTIYDISFKPFDYDPNVFINFDAAVDNVLYEHNIFDGDINKLPLSAFSNYVKSKETLKIHDIKRGVENFIGNDMYYVSGGSTLFEFVTGQAVKAANPVRNLLNRYHATVNITPEASTRLKSEIAAHLLPHRTSILTFVSFSPRPFYFKERIEQNRVYIFPDPTLYGNGFGSQSYEQEIPVDHTEFNTWFKAPPVDIGLAGRVTNAAVKSPLFYNYTSTEQTLGSPQYGISKFTDNYDFWNGSDYGNIWANPDIYPLKEANRFPLTSRQTDLLTDFCDTPVEWRTSIHGNQFVLYKASTQPVKLPGGGSDQDEDGKDDTYIPGLGEPDYRLFSENEYGTVVDGSGGAGTSKATRAGGTPGGGEGDLECEPVWCESKNTYVESKWNDETKSCKPINCFESSEDINFGESDQKPLRDCKYFLYGGDTFDPEKTANNLDVTYHFHNPLDGTPAKRAYTEVGSVSAIIDGGWRPLRAGSFSHSPDAARGDWPIAGGTNEDQSQNQFQVIGHGTSYGADYLNGFFDHGMYASASAAFDPADVTHEAEWLPDWTVREEGENTYDDTRTHFPRILPTTNNIASYDYTTTFEDFTTEGQDRAYRNTTSRKEWETHFKYVIADAGWYQGNDPDNTFFETRCDRATYILATYGSEEPDFGNNIFACKMFRITNSAMSDISMFPPTPEGLQAYKRAAIRGPLDARTCRNPVEARIGGRKPVQFFGTLEMLKEFIRRFSIPLREDMFVWLEREEYDRMRVSKIEGTGSYRKGLLDGEKLFIDEELASVEPTNGRPLIKGDPDVFYYNQSGEGPNDLEYTSASGTCSYIGTFITDTTAPSDWQFPQVPWYDATNSVDGIRLFRDFNVPLSAYNEFEIPYNDLDCDVVNEYRQYNTVLVNPDGEDILVDQNDYSVLRPPLTGNPFLYVPGYDVYEDDKFISKRGYFPPPVGHLRRVRTRPASADGTGRSIGVDKPIFDNFIPGTDDANLTSSLGPSGFFVHDVWDGSGFAMFDPEDFNLSPEDSGDASGQPTTNTGSKAKFGKCHNAWVEAGSPPDIRYIANDQNECVPVPVSSLSGTCTTCVTLTTGEYLDLNCGDYTGYFSPEQTGENLPCQVQYVNVPADGQTPIKDIALMVKRASDTVRFDWCESIESPTLWEQLNGTIRYSTAPENVYCRSINNKIGTLQETIPTLFEKYSTFAGQTVIDIDQPFIGMDVIYDILLLRQKLPDEDVESIVIDKLQYSYERDETSVVGTATQYVKTSPNNLSQVLGHFFNEDENCIIVGVTRKLNDTTVFPELWRLDITNMYWDKVYPRKEDESRLYQDFTIQDTGGTIKNIDPGHISFNDRTGNYSITYTGYLSSPETDVDAYCVFYHVFSPLTEKSDTLKPTSINMTQTPAGVENVISEDDPVSTQFILNGLSDTDDEGVVVRGLKHSVDIDLQGVDETGPGDLRQMLSMDIDWGDGERCAIYRDFRSDSSLQRYGDEGKANLLTKNTILYSRYGTGTDPLNDTSLNRHMLTHTYDLSGGNYTYDIKISGKYSDGASTYSKTISLTAASYTMRDAFTDLKLIQTKLASPNNEKPQEEVLFLTLETQEPRYIIYQTIDIDPVPIDQDPRYTDFKNVDILRGSFSDDDKDGVANLYDAFPTDPDETTDSDGDLIGDNTDPDDDNDGILDVDDAFPFNPAESSDRDNDGVGDNADVFPDEPTETVDTDGDLVGDNADVFPDDPTETVDTDSDLVGDNADYFRNNATYTYTLAELNALVEDRSNIVTNEIVKWIDASTDGGFGFVLNAYYTVHSVTSGDVEPVDNGGNIISAGTPSMLNTDRGTKWIKVAPADTDTDEDGVPNPLDVFPDDPTETVDTDEDGVGDNADVFPDDPTETVDTDGDLVGDNSDPDPTDPDLSVDVDGDGIDDSIDEDFADTDSDGILNIDDPDDDNDTVLDVNDDFPLDPTETTDTDGDGVGDNTDFDPSDPEQTIDSDNDGVSDEAETTAGTDPNDPDSDNDGISDADEIAAGTDPTDNSSFVFTGTPTETIVINLPEGTDVFQIVEGETINGKVFWRTE